MNKKKKARRTLAMTLIFTIMLQLIPPGISSFAATESTGQTAREEEAGRIIAELTDKRTENEKHFLLEDGTIQAVSYGVPVHYEDGGRWKEIDNTLVDAETENGTGQVYENTANSFQVQFAKEADEEQLVTIQDEGYRISWSFVEPVFRSRTADPQLEPLIMREITADVTNFEMQSMPQDAQEQTNAEYLDQSKVNAQIVYPEIRDGVDLQYQVQPKGVKENIVVKTRQEQYDYYLKLVAEGVMPQKQTDGSIAFVSEDAQETVFTIPAPYMYDAGGAYSTAVTQDVSPYGDGYLLHVAADKNWMNDEKRQFPIVIDPEVEMQYKYNSGAMQETVDSSQPDTNFHYERYSYVGETANGIQKTYVRLPLPELQNGDQIVSAVYTAFMEDSDVYSAFCFPMQVKKVSSSWDESVTWNTRPNIHSSEEIVDVAIYDYVAMSGKSSASVDITQLVKKWYNGEENYGFVLEPGERTDTYNNQTVPMRSIYYASWHETLPMLTVRYVNNNGLEDYWSYRTVEVGAAGIGYVNDFTGNLVFTHGDAATTGDLMPVSVSHVYNSSQNDSNTSFKPYAGKGWMLSLHQSFVPITNQGLLDKGYRYLYTDEDGTVHYFNDTHDYDGLGLTVSKNLSDTEHYYVLTDTGDGRMFFDQSGKLTRLQDGKGHAADLTYTNDVLTSITDALGQSITLTSNTDGYLTKVTDPAGRAISYTYDQDGYLTGITYPDETCSVYSYSEDHLLNKITDPTGYSIQYEYTETAPKKVHYIKEYAAQALGQTMELIYGNDNTTKFRTAGPDDIFGNQDDEIITCNYDDMGRGYSCYDQDGYGVANTYLDDIGSRRNKISNRVNLIKPAVNLLYNHSAEQDGYWTAAAENTGTAGMTDDDAYIGYKAFQFSTTAKTQKAHYTKTLNLRPGSYTFSGYVSTAGLDGTRGAVLKAEISGTPQILKESDPVRDTNGQWKRVQTTFEVTDASQNVTLSFGIEHTQGTARFDALQLEEGTVPNEYNLLENAGFEDDEIGTAAPPTAWNKNYGESDYYFGEVVSGGQKQGEQYFKLKGTQYDVSGFSTYEKSLSQNVPVNASAGDMYVLSGWIKVNPTKQSPIIWGDYALYAPSFYFDATVKVGNSTTVQPISINKHTTDWQYFSHVLSFEDVSGQIDQIGMQVTYTNNINAVCLDGLQLSRSYVETYQYDENGNIVSQTTADGQQGSYTYDANNNLTGSSDSLGNSEDYTYDENDNLIQSNNGDGTYSHYNYDEHGRPTFSALGDANDLVAATMRIREETTYSSSGLVTSQTNSMGKTNIYTVDDTKGLTTSQTDALGNRISYRYNADNDRLETITADRDTDSVSIGYSYNSGGRLSQILHNGFAYNLGYDGFGNQTFIKAGSQNLTSYEYGPYNGKLQKTTYGNGDYVENIYDQYGRSIGTKFNGTEKYSVQYAPDGSVEKHLDHANNVTYTYEYDARGNLVRQVGSDGSRIEYIYDNKGVLSETQYTVNGQTRTTSVTYDDNNRITSQKFNDTEEYRVTYDGLGRLLGTRKYHLGPAETLVTDMQVQYAADRGAEGYTTQAASYLLDGATFEQVNQFDDNGRITSSGENGGTSLNYTYDELGQLVKEVNSQTGKTTVISYDDGGNILSKKVYPNGQAAENEPEKTYAYTYGDVNWPDKLTAFDGKAITYDAIGNMTGYDGRTYSWVDGRKLASIRGGGLDLSYQYDADGLRTKKTSGASETEYFYEGSQLVHEQRGNDSIWYYYNADGTPFGIEWNGTMYYYSSNAQGDVCKIYDAAGNVQAHYQYDSWGNITAVLDGNGGAVTSQNHIAHVNPLRYRGYYYDSDTGYYYLQSRYYDPEMSRFISADAIVGANEDMLAYNLFAYCSNDPVNFVDYGGALALTSIYKYAQRFFKLVIPPYRAISSAQRNSNRSYNSKLSFSGYIYDQSVGSASRARMGFWTGSYNGCGWIATYNVNLMLGSPVHPSNIIYYYERWGSILQGAFGVLPDAVADYFRSRGRRVSQLNLTNSGIDKSIKGARGSVLMYAHSKGMHYIAIRWTGKQFHAYNFTGSRSYRSFSSIEGFLRSNSYRAISLISIR